MIKQLDNLIKKYNTIIIHRHAKPDGDAIGSQVGLKELILTNYRNKTVYLVGDNAGRYGFIKGSDMDAIDDSTFENALSIVLDTSSPELVSDNRYTKAKISYRIDHHLYIDKFTNYELVVNYYESCCGLITFIAQSLNWKISTNAATALFTGMVTDSGRFRYDSTSSKTFKMASLLMESNVDTSSIYTNLYQEDFSKVLNRAKFITNIKFTKKNVAYVYTTKEQLAEYNTDSSTISRGMVNCMSDIKNVYIWVNFTETDDGILCEIRSNKYNINPVAVKYGGGGHAKASGATLHSREECNNMLLDLNQIIENDI